MSFGSYEDAESFLLRDKTIVKAKQKYANRRFFDDGVVYQSTKRYMSDTPDGEQIGKSSVSCPLKPSDSAPLC